MRACGDLGSFLPSGSFWIVRVVLGRFVKFVRNRRKGTITQGFQGAQGIELSIRGWIAIRGGGAGEAFRLVLRETGHLHNGESGLRRGFWGGRGVTKYGKIG